ncbi:MAG: ABC transporter permease subunit [Myxococcales bacterium]|nr:ABC transporter permease [Myxococcota bacterium]MDW8283919.1 ABC transporter permease subunit [Myxococcales bacterium]
MRNITTIARRELGAYFNSPIAYVVVAVFLLLSALLFFNALFIQGQAELRELFNGFWTTLLVAIVGPAISMRLLAEEKQNDTLELLLTMPVTDWQVVLGKYLAALGLFAFAMAMMALFGVSVRLLGPLDLGPALSGFLGLFFTAAAYIAVGLMTSSFTKNQIVAFILGVLICLSLWLIGKVVPVFPPWLQPTLDWLGADSHINNLARGVIDTRDLLYYATIIFSCLLITQTTLESRRWR